jgi:hypothetical protein
MIDLPAAKRGIAMKRAVYLPAARPRRRNFPVGFVDPAHCSGPTVAALQHRDERTSVRPPRA